MGASNRIQHPLSTEAIRWLTCLMFFMFAMTTDSVGAIIPQVIAEFRLNLTTAGALHYGSMVGIATAGIGLGFLADRFGRKATILLGLALFAATAFCVPLAPEFTFLLALVSLAGVAIGVFKTGALALVGDLSKSTTELTSTMNLVEGFFGVGAIVGPLLVGMLIARGVSWRWLYIVAGVLCVVLLIIALFARYPEVDRGRERPASMVSSLRFVADRYALGFSAGAFLYVAVECAIYVWMPTLLDGLHERTWLPLSVALPLFFVMRAVGRFVGAWLLSRFEWSLALLVCAIAIFACFLGSMLLGLGAALYLLPASGLFMSIVYPTVNSKGIGCFDAADQGSVAGIILFFTCAGAFLGPLAMSVISDLSGSPRNGFVLATGFAGVFLAGCLYNHLRRPAHARLARFT